MISSAVPRSTLLSVSINDVNNSENNCPNKSCRLRNGLITRQSYAITGLTRVRTVSMNEIPSHPNQNFIYSLHPYQVHGNNQFPHNNNISGHNGIVEVQLIRLKNVWHKGEWNGG
jgi:hypothetical protein